MDQAELREALAPLTGSAAGASHPSDDELLAYGAGELPQAREREVGAHLSGCRRCIELVLDLEPLLAAAPPEPDEVADLELEAAWRRLRDGLAGADEEAGASAPRAPASRPPRWLGALAATLAVSTIALGLWVARLERALDLHEQQLTEISGPRGNLPIHYLDAATRGREEVLELAPSEPLVVLILTPREPDAAAEYALTVATAAGEVVWRGEGLVASDYGTVRVGLPTRLLPAGRYRLELASGPEPAGEYPLEVRYRSP